jgi:acyl carrier protein
MDSLEQTIIAIIADKAMLDPADISVEMSLADLGVDSLGLVEAIFGIEEAFNISVPFNANEPGKSGFDLTSVASIIQAVEGLVAQQAA